MSEVNKPGFTVNLELPYEAAVARVTEALKEQGFGVLTEIDFQATLKQKLAVDFRRYVVLGACNPPLAHWALQEDVNMGLMLPCNVIVYEADDGPGSIVSLANPLIMAQFSDSPAMRAIAEDAHDRIMAVVAALS